MMRPLDTLKTTFLATLLLFAAHAAAAPDGPEAQVRETVDAVITVLRDSALDPDGRRQRIRAQMDKRFDFETMSRSILALNWKKASAAERKRFLELFPELMLQTYLAGMESYTNEEVKILGSQTKNSKATVDTAILSGNKQIPVSYRLRQDGDGWFVYDVIVEGVSLVRTYRDSFDGTIRGEGMEGLLTQLASKIETLRNARGGASG